MSTNNPANDPSDDETETGLEAKEYLDALERIWEHALKVLGSDGLTVADIRVTIRRREPLAGADPGPAAAASGALLPHLRWLLTQSAAGIADAAHQFETRTGDVDENALDQLRDDVLLIDEELAALKALLIAPADWDAEYGRLLAGEIPPFESDADDFDD
jgi:hypothetical protein